MQPRRASVPLVTLMTFVSLGLLGATACSTHPEAPERNADMRRTIENNIPGGLPISAAVVAGGLCFTGAQFGIDADNRPVGDVERQTALALDHLEEVLKHAGTRLDLVVRITVYLRSLDDFDAMNRAYRGRFPKSPPARVTIGAKDLLFGAAMELDAVAAMPD